MPSPPRRPRGSPPRQALYERSDSHTNERGSPTLRVVGEPQESIYGRSPYPTKPSQILLPSGQYSQQQLAFEGNPYEQDPRTNLPTLSQITEPSKEDRGFNSRQGSDAGRLTERSSADVSFYTASARNSTAFGTPNAERSNSSFALNRLGSSIRQITDDAGPPESEVQSAQDSSAASSPRQPSNKVSDNSLSSVNSTGTVIVKKTRDGKKRISYSAFPHTGRPTSSRSNVSTPTSQRSSPKIVDEQSAQRSPLISNSSSSPTFPSSPERRISSAPAESDGSPSRIQYPVIKPPSASGSWAESSTAAPRVPPRALERAQQRWNPHLSTVQSIRSSSLSGERNSQNLWLPDSSRASKGSSIMPGSHESSDMPPLPGTKSPETALISRGKAGASMHPTPSVDMATSPPFRQRDSTGSTIRVVSDQDDEKLDIPPTIPGSRDSNGAVSAPKIRRTTVVARPGSRASFFQDSIPAWAKSYYGRPMSSSSILDRRDSTSTDKISINMLRGQNRPQRSSHPLDRRISGLRMHPTRPGELNLDDITGPNRRRISPTWSPHLWHDRTSLGRRRSLFKAPSIDEAAEGNAITKRNAQVLLFTLGFIFPFAWFIASFLPLPPEPDFGSAKGKKVQRQTQILLDLEKQLGPTDLARYENARWWRNINRIMCFVGVTVIIIIVSSPFQ